MLWKRKNFKFRLFLDSPRGHFASSISTLTRVIRPVREMKNDEPFFALPESARFQLNSRQSGFIATNKSHCISRTKKKKKLCPFGRNEPPTEIREKGKISAMYNGGGISGYGFGFTRKKRKTDWNTLKIMAKQNTAGLSLLITRNPLGRPTRNKSHLIRG